VSEIYRNLRTFIDIHCAPDAKGVIMGDGAVLNEANFTGGPGSRIAISNGNVRVDAFRLNATTTTENEEEILK
jgi:hypothetical protein